MVEYEPTGAGVAVFGLASGLAFAFALNGYRQAGLALEPQHPIFAATAGVVVAQTYQTLLLGSALAGSAVSDQDPGRA